MDKDRQKQLEAAYERGLRAEKQGDFSAAAAAYRQMLALDKADCAGAAVRLASIGRGETPQSAPKAYVATLFDQHADVFDMILVDKLGYDVPNKLAAALCGHYPRRVFKSLLDLGCGTGLAGEACADLAALKTGIDLSEKMVEMAAEREIYDSLYVGDAAQFLREASAWGKEKAEMVNKNKNNSGMVNKKVNAETGEARWDLILAADVLPYLGALDGFFALIAAVLEKGGVFGFSSENLDKTKAPRGQNKAGDKSGGADFAVGPHQRFAHSPAYLARVLDKCGFKTIAAADIIVRREQNSPVCGQLILAEKMS